MPEFGSYDPARWGWPVPGAGEIVPFVYAGANFTGGVAALARPVFAQALLELTRDAGLVLNTDPSLTSGNWGQSTRRISGSGRWSFHAYGLAIDIAAPWNPRGDLDPPASPYRVPDGTGARLSHLGIEWGGDWARGSVDRMHLEIHMGPVECAAVFGGQLPPPAGGRHYPLPAGCYYGWYSGPASSISGSGRNDAPYREGLAAAQRVLGVDPDGYYGPVTAEATIRWQSSHGLSADGLIGPDTWRSLFPG